MRDLHPAYHYARADDHHDHDFLDNYEHDFLHNYEHDHVHQHDCWADDHLHHDDWWADDYVHHHERNDRASLRVHWCHMQHPK